MPYTWTHSNPQTKHSTTVVGPKTNSGPSHIRNEQEMAESPRPVLASSLYPSARPRLIFHTGPHAPPPWPRVICSGSSSVRSERWSVSNGGREVRVEAFLQRLAARRGEAAIPFLSSLVTGPSRRSRLEWLPLHSEFGLRRGRRGEHEITPLHMTSAKGHHHSWWRQEVIPDLLMLLASNFLFIALFSPRPPAFITTLVLRADLRSWYILAAARSHYRNFG